MSRWAYKLRAKRVRQLLELEMFSNQEMQEMAEAILEAIVIKVLNVRLIFVTFQFQFIKSVPCFQDRAIENARLKNKTMGARLTSLGKYLTEAETAEIDDKDKTREKWKTELLKKTSIANENFSQVTFQQPQQKTGAIRRSKSTVM